MKLVLPKFTFDLSRPFRMEGMKRVDDTPQHKAVREAFTNAIIHADVFLPGGVLRIDKYDNRLVLRNPGTQRLPIEKIYEGGTSRARNPHIQNMLRIIGYGENLGSGFPIIMNAWKQSGWGEPVLENRIDIDEVALILTVQTEKNTIQETREKIFNAIRKNPNITTSELAEKLTITIKGVEWQLKSLREQGFIRRVGPDKGGHWEILNEKMA
jgi:predicted HTH transcriptional regulator